MSNTENTNENNPAPGEEKKTPYVRKNPGLSKHVLAALSRYPDEPLSIDQILAVLRRELGVKIHKGKNGANAAVSSAARNLVNDPSSPVARVGRGKYKYLSEFDPKAKKAGAYDQPGPDLPKKDVPLPTVVAPTPKKDAPKTVDPTPVASPSPTFEELQRMYSPEEEEEVIEWPDQLLLIPGTQGEYVGADDHRYTATRA